NTNGYIEFNIQFVTAGTSTPVVQTMVAATPIDVDGDNNVKEFDQIQRVNGVVDYNVTGLELSISYASGWFTGTNIGGVDYSGIDTSAKGVMFTVINTNLSSFRIRTGVNNQGGSNVNRLRSVYFRRFIYPVSALLPLSHLISFTGAAGSNKVNLNWELASGHSFIKVIVERSENGNTFIAVNETTVVSADKNIKASYTDFKINDGNVYYRLKMITVAGKTEYSNVLVFKSGNSNSAKQIKVYPTAIQSSVAVNVTTENSGSAVFQIADYSGRIVYQQAVNLQAGNNSVAVQGLDKLMKGNYIALVKQGNSVQQQKVVKL
ncbi:MAG: T9SS type A sorting domain-containing protein, partial [Chitinophagaceae bacterium]|nr:T9SS type A sorting domain-containing protein [Chitinophagaceae bacterium]